MSKREFHPPHVYEDNACFFITAGIVHGQKLLGTDAKRRMFRDVLREATSQYGIRLYAWVILAEHYHLLLKTSDVAPLWKFLKRLHGESAIQLNKLDHVAGRKVWYQYWDRCPRCLAEFWTLFNYIHVNPAKHGYVRVSDRVYAQTSEGPELALDQIQNVHRVLATYEYSSYGYYLRTYGEEFLADAWARYPVLTHLGPDEF